MNISYDPTREALLHPAVRATLFKAGDAGRLSLDAICAECSRLAYLRFESSEEHRALLRDALALLGAVDWAGFNDPATGTQAFAAVVPAKARALVVFRGTEPDRVSDIGVDLDASTTTWPAGGTVHAGFANAFDGVKSKIGDWLARHPGIDVVFSGHSLGAALATLSASNWVASNLITFGSPRVGNPGFAQTIKAQAVARYVDCCDVVPHVPPETPWYSHVGEALYIDHTGKLCARITQDEIEVDRAKARIDYIEQYAWRLDSAPVRDLADHAPINYERALLPAT